ncbi:hypothetical protein HBI81_043680 [Parastagonospora nodorum]|nr:hypothetical protein HBI05_083490 [Parastagonospora nodorum]KAH4244137.1 hypothetical protein HBI06_008490 [Parastagonospora nodorum]KAH4262342.1 hypothetical protein HBI03_109550 [Parastagonospora nodorum]KAH4280969.1 hypothetical protein HBI04_051060 [Parastagonospora nodorum]KAH4816054.1 hypothetical protein HBH61_061840 [Parastagonospora nodorum]
MSSLDPLLIFFSEIPDSLGYSTASLHYITFQDTSMRAATRKEMSMSPFATSPSPGCRGLSCLTQQQLLCLCPNRFPTHRKRKTIMPHLPHTPILCKPPPSILLPTPLPRLPLRCHAQPPCSQHRKGREGGFFIKIGWDSHGRAREDFVVSLFCFV